MNRSKKTNFTKQVRARFAELLKERPLITAWVYTTYRQAEGFNGTAAILWYPHQNNRDEKRIVSEEKGPPRIVNLSVDEVGKLTTVVAQVAENFPQLEVRLALMNRGEFWYHFITKKK